MLAIFAISACLLIQQLYQEIALRQRLHPILYNHFLSVTLPKNYDKEYIE